MSRTATMHAKRGAIAVPRNRTGSTPEAASRMKCQNNLKQMGLAMHNYHDVYNSFPRGNLGTWGNDHGSWMFATLPFMEQDNLYKLVTSVVGPHGERYDSFNWDMSFAVAAGVLPK